MGGGRFSDLRDVAQLLQGGGGGRGRRRVALLHQVGEVPHVAVTPDAVALGVAASPPLLRRLGGGDGEEEGEERERKRRAGRNRWRQSGRKGGKLGQF